MKCTSTSIIHLILMVIGLSVIEKEISATSCSSMLFVVSLMLDEVFCFAVNNAPGCNITIDIIVSNVGDSVVIVLIPFSDVF